MSNFKDSYDGITAEDILSLIELKLKNSHVYNGSFIVKPTGNIANDGSAEVEIIPLPQKAKKENFTAEDFDNQAWLVDELTTKLGGESWTKEQLQTIKELSFNNKDFSGQHIPVGIKYLTNLERLSITACNLEGEIPSFKNNTNLIYLSLNNNLLIGTLAVIEKNSNLEYVAMNNNKLTGEIIDFKSAIKLSSLDLANNQLEGSIPTFENNLALKTLTLTNNKLTGKLPSFENNLQLSNVTANNNQLSGEMPSFENNIALTALSFTNNKLTGRIPTFINNTKLMSFYAQNNQLVGPVALPAKVMLKSVTNNFLANQSSQKALTAVNVTMSVNEVLDFFSLIKYNATSNDWSDTLEWDEVPTIENTSVVSSQGGTTIKAIAAGATTVKYGMKQRAETGNANAEFVLTVTVE